MWPARQHRRCARKVRVAVVRNTDSILNIYVCMYDVLKTDQSINRFLQWQSPYFRGKSIHQSEQHQLLFGDSNDWESNQNGSHSSSRRAQSTIRGSPQIDDATAVASERHVSVSLDCCLEEICLPGTEVVLCCPLSTQHISLHVHATVLATVVVPELHRGTSDDSRAAIGSSSVFY